MYLLMDSTIELIDSTLEKTKEGYLNIDAIISRSGVQKYLAQELGIFNGNPDKIIELERPPEEVTDSESLASFINMPITDEHPMGGQVNSANYKTLSKGMVLSVEPTEQNQVKARLRVMDETLINKIEAGKRELSAGYTAEIEFSADGNSAVQRKIRGNHVAFVDTARGGKECRIFDCMPTNIPKEEKMANMKIKDVEYEVADSLVPVIQSLLADASNDIDKINDMAEDATKEKAKLDAAEEKIKKMEDEDEDEVTDEEMEKKVEDAANLRVGVLLAASKFLKDYDPSGKSISTIKLDVLTDALPNLDLADKDAVYLDARFDILVEDGETKSKGSQTLNDGLTQQMEDGTVLTDAVAIARANKIKRGQDAYKVGEK